jgi:hypothetical protein
MLTSSCEDVTVTKLANHCTYQACLYTYNVRYIYYEEKGSIPDEVVEFLFSIGLILPATL